MLKIFRKFTRFKRFTFGVTKFRRRSWFRLKSRRNWFPLHFALIWGLELYRFFRNLYRFQTYFLITNFSSPSFVGTWYGGVWFSFSAVPTASYLASLSLKLRRAVGSYTANSVYSQELGSLFPLIPVNVGLQLPRVGYSQFDLLKWDGRIEEIRKMLDIFFLYELALVQETYFKLVLWVRNQL